MSSTLLVYNTLSRQKERFVPIVGKIVRMFVCGQTVYDDAHLGHAKNYINFDIIARWLRHEGYKLTYIQNITDVEDKIIARAQESAIPADELARKYEARFMEDMDAIGVRRGVDMYPRSHDYIDAIAGQIRTLLEKRHAYISNGDVYYEVDKFTDYAKLSGVKVEELTMHRIEPGEGKRKPYDFALWKAAKHGEPSWRISVVENGKTVELNGRPGWHIEDTATTEAIFGPQYEIHGGASELIFPHHTNEIAQAEAASGKKPFVKYWLHTGVLRVNGEKMSKSLKNFITIRELLKRYDPEALRMMVASTHYAKEIDFSESLIKDANNRLSFLYSSLAVFYNSPTSPRTGNAGRAAADALVASVLKEIEDGFPQAMDNNFDTSLAISVLWKGISELRKLAEAGQKPSREARELAMGKILELAGTLGILEKDTYKQVPTTEQMDQIRNREKLREAKKFKEADAIRDRLKEEDGITLEDTEYGTIWFIEKGTAR